MSYFIENPIGIAEIAVSPGMVGVMGEAADGIAKLAQGDAPVDTGTYLASITSTSGIDGLAAYGAVYSDVDYAIYIEFGTTDTPTFQPIRLALDAFRL